MILTIQCRDQKYGSKERSPGPAAYSYDHYRRSSDGWTFGVKHKDYFKIIDMPGPGSYNAQRKSKVPLGKIGTSKRNSKSTSYQSPGPGTYNHPSSLKKNGWSIQGKRKQRGSSEDLGPGPASYNPKLPEINGGTPAWTLGGKHKNKEGETLGPGPNTYFPSINPVKPRPKSAAFTKGKRDKKHGYEIPGPGNYSIKSTVGGGPKYGITGRPKTSKREADGPGPTAYHPNCNYTKPRPKSAKIGKSKRMSKVVDNTPGPGQYERKPKLDKRGGKIGSAKRPSSAIKSEGPGPASYLLPSYIGTKPGKTIGGKRQEKSADNLPGPGAYHKVGLPSGPAYSIAGKGGKDFDMIENSKKPGPNTYYPSYDQVLPFNPGKSMGVKSSIERQDNMPGPGAYKYYDFYNKSNGWTMGHRPQTKEFENSPGPAAYYPSVSNVKDSSPAFTMGMQRAPYKGNY